MSASSITDVFGAIGAGTVLLDSGATGFAPELREALIGLLGTVAESGHTLVPVPEDPPTDCRGCGGTGERYDGTGPDGHAWSGESCCCSHEHCSCGACAFPCELASYAMEVAKELVSFPALRSGERPSQAAGTAEAYPGELAMYRQLVRTLRADVRPDDADLNQVRDRLHQHAAADVTAREEAKGKSSHPANATPRLTGRRARLLDAIRAHRGRWDTGRVLDLYRLTEPGHIQRVTARRDLGYLQWCGYLDQHGPANGRFYTLKARKDGAK
ncbi:hypothetical protein [Streptomyces sp. NPDC058424]|uniref:hypothetical protein n=1 Tax=Streptomyces sp. NPDC058424 TaxID=3346491 RepID=UPI003655518B